MIKKTTLLIMMTIITTLGYFYLSQTSLETKIKQCLTKKLVSNNINSLEIITKNKVNKPIIRGMVKKETKKLALEVTYNQCGDIQIQDEIDIIPLTIAHNAIIHFSIDNFNKIITINGQLKNKTQYQQILKIFAVALPNMTLKHEAIFDALITDDTIAENLVFLLPSVKKIQVANITLSTDTLILKGLVRNKSTEKQILTTLKQIFTDELTINNLLEPVVKTNIKINSLPFKQQIPPIFNTEQSK